MARRDAVVIMPTGAGKSLCYQIPAIATGGLTIVISPLIALMKDQVEALRANGVSAAAINSSIDRGEQMATIDLLAKGKLQLLYLSPERAVTDRFLSFIRSYKVDYVAIDEAHCVSIWGNDFRPEYTRLTELLKVLPDATVLALTATADHATRLDIQARLGLGDSAVFVSSFERTNITIDVKPALQRIDHIKRYLLKRRGEAGIIYCLSRKSTESLASKLREVGISAEAYHARLDRAVKDEVQNRFQRDEVQVVCATIAFGMGIDKSNIRFVIHYNLPKNIEAYYQEIGRAGRDGEPAEAILYAGYNDVATYRSMIDDSDADATFREVQTQKLDRIWEFAQATSCRTNVILAYFGEYRAEGCQHCDNCLSPPDTIDGTVIAQKALSAVLRCGEQVGVQLLADILRGSYRAEVREGGYEKIKTFGAGRDIPRVHWLQYIVQLTNVGALSIDYTRGARLSMTDQGRAILRGEAPVRLTEPRDQKTSSDKQIRVRKVTKSELFQNGLLEHLKLWRQAIAKEEKISPGNVLNDKTLLGISVKVPFWPESLADIDGMSSLKRKSYGPGLLTAVHLYVGQQKHKKSIKGKTLLDSYLLYKKGLDAKEMADKRGLSVGTIYKHMSDLLKVGQEVDIFRFVTQKQIDKVARVMHEQNTTHPEDIAGYITEVIGLHEIGLIVTYHQLERTL